jgi:hypothetical protein
MTTTYVFYNFNTEENYIVALTDEQIRLLKWLQKNSFICEDDIFSEIKSGLEII